MSCFYQSVRTKGIWIIIFCSVFSLFYIAHQMNKLKFSKPYALIEIVTGKDSVIELEMIANSKDGNKSSNIVKNNMNKGKLARETFLGRQDESSHLASWQNDSEIMKIPRVKNESIHRTSNKNNFSIKTETRNCSDIKVGILIPSSTRRIKKPDLGKLSLTKICIPSIYKTAETDYTYVIYVGIDKGDYLETVKDKLETMFDKVKSVVTKGRTFTKTVNAIARQAYQDEMDYLVRINDDSSFESQNWTSKAIAVLQNYSPPNIGVVGPTCREGNTGILTHDMVHSTHVEIFDFYYPPYFDNWWADDWITKVYKPERSTKLSTWLVKHHTSSHGTGYNVDTKQHSRLNKTLTFDKERLTKYLSQYKTLTNILR